MVATSLLANFRRTMTITVGMVGPQRGVAINHLLILMFQVKSGTGDIRQAAIAVHACVQPLTAHEPK